jgi:hypothetical protein
MSAAKQNSQAALDWAKKRQQQLERAAAIKAERQATLRSQRPTGELDAMEGEPSAKPTPSQRRTYSQPASDQQANGGLDEMQAHLPMRPNTEAGDSAHLPEWAREMNFSSNRKAGAAAEHRAYGHPESAPDSHFPYNGYADEPYDGGPPSPSCGELERGGRDGSHGAHAYGAHAYGAAQAVANWPADMPLGQSDGGIGYNRGRAMPRGPPKDLAIDFVGLPSERTKPTLAAAEFFGLDGPMQPRRGSRRSPPSPIRRRRSSSTRNNMRSSSSSSLRIRRRGMRRCISTRSSSSITPRTRHLRRSSSSSTRTLRLGTRRPARPPLRSPHAGGGARRLRSRSSTTTATAPAALPATALAATRTARMVGTARPAPPARRWAGFSVGFSLSRIIRTGPTHCSGRRGSGGATAAAAAAAPALTTALSDLVPMYLIWVHPLI